MRDRVDGAASAVTLQQIRSRTAHQSIIASGARKLVVASAAEQHVIALSTDQPVGPGVAGQSAGPIPGVDVLDTDQGLVLAAGTLPARATQVDEEGLRSEPTADGVRTGATIDVIGALPAVAEVVEPAAAQEVTTLLSSKELAVPRAA